MHKIESVCQLAEQLEFDVSSSTTTVRDVVQALVCCGRADKVLAFHDSHLGLERSLPEELLNTSLRDIVDVEKSERYEDEIENLLDEGDSVLALFTRKLTEEDRETIHEDRQSRGEENDD